MSFTTRVARRQTYINCYDIHCLYRIKYIDTSLTGKEMNSIETRFSKKREKTIHTFPLCINNIINLKIPKVQIEILKQLIIDVPVTQCTW